LIFGVFYHESGSVRFVEKYSEQTKLLILTQSHMPIFEIFKLPLLAVNRVLLTSNKRLLVAIVPVIFWLKYTNFISTLHQNKSG
jgi:hypothetical protein